MNFYERKQAELAERRRLADEAAAKIRADRAAAKLGSEPPSTVEIASSEEIEDVVFADVDEEPPVVPLINDDPFRPFKVGMEMVKEPADDEAEESGEELPIAAADSSEPTIINEPKRKRGRKRKK